MVVFGAGRTGFEPAVLVAKHNRLAGGPNRPLWHLPIFIEIVIQQTEGEGFEPPVTRSATMVFKTTAIVHSAIPP